MGISQFSQFQARSQARDSSATSPRKRKRDELRKALALDDTYDQRRRKSKFIIFISEIGAIQL